MHESRGKWCHVQEIGGSSVGCVRWAGTVQQGQSVPGKGERGGAVCRNGEGGGVQCARDGTEVQGARKGGIMKGGEMMKAREGVRFREE